MLMLMCFLGSEYTFTNTNPVRSKATHATAAIDWVQTTDDRT